MLKLVLTITILGLTFHLSGQQQLLLEIEEASVGREVIKATNSYTGSTGAIFINLSAGIENQLAENYLSTFAGQYTANPGYAGYLDLDGRSTGINLRATHANGNIRFLTGGSAIATQTRMLIDPTGNVRIGSATPSARLEVANGSIYLSDGNSFLILKSSNGSCWNVTINNAGALTTTSGPCP